MQSNSHGLSVVEHIADDLVAMYLGRPVEHGIKEMIFRHPGSPYTRALLASAPFVDPTKRAERVVLSGELPSPINPPSGCAFHRRCPFATDVCGADRPELRPVDGRDVACHHAEMVN